jgi:uncharacterized phage protein (TIGR02220 family)
MARARNIKPGLYKNEDLAECSIWARYLFPGLWMLADREGRLEDRPKRIKGELLPFDSQDVEPLLRELTTRGFVLRYQVDGASYIQISKFKEHQTPHYSEKQSVIKPPPLQEIAPSISPPNSEKPPGLKEGSQPPDSLIHRLSDSLNPESLEKASSGLPDPRPDRLNGYRAQAKEILDFLNDKTGRAYRAVDANLEPIVARLKEGTSADDVRAVVAKKCREWIGNEKMAEFLRPKTLFNRTNFANYEGELGQSLEAP